MKICGLKFTVFAVSLLVFGLLGMRIAYASDNVDASSTAWDINLSGKYLLQSFGNAGWIDGIYFRGQYLPSPIGYNFWLCKGSLSGDTSKIWSDDVQPCINGTKKELYQTGTTTMITYQNSAWQDIIFLSRIITETDSQYYFILQQIGTDLNLKGSYIANDYPAGKGERINENSDPYVINNLNFVSYRDLNTDTILVTFPAMNRVKDFNAWQGKYKMASVFDPSIQVGEIKVEYADQLDYFYRATTTADFTDFTLLKRHVLSDGTYIATATLQIVDPSDRTIQILDQYNFSFIVDHINGLDQYGLNDSAKCPASLDTISYGFCDLGVYLFTPDPEIIRTILGNTSVSNAIFGQLQSSYTQMIATSSSNASTTAMDEVGFNMNLAGYGTTTYPIFSISALRLYLGQSTIDLFRNLIRFFAYFGFGYYVIMKALKFFKVEES